MIIKRKWAMPNKETFRVKPINELIKRYINKGLWVDMFVGYSVFKDICHTTNDINHDIVATKNRSALDCLESLPRDYFDGALFDPPYSPRQIKESYENAGIEVHKTDTQSSFYGSVKNEIAEVVKAGGHVISCGWNSNGMGKSRGFELEEVLLVPHGAAHNDTIVTIERRIK